jgi:uncharacterized protein YndB with AHSA1/START domain
MAMPTKEVAQMARIEESVEIKRPVDKVFAYTTDAKSWPKWQSMLPEAEQTSQGKVGVGTTFKGVVRLMGLGMKWTAEVTEYEPNKHWGKTITSGSIVNKERLICDPTAVGTKFTIVYEMNAGGFMKLFSPMIVCSMRKETKKSLGNLKRLLEAQT